jgi:hypothetical protein
MYSFNYCTLFHNTFEHACSAHASRFNIVIKPSFNYHTSIVNAVIHFVNASEMYTYIHTTYIHTYILTYIHTYICFVLPFDCECAGPIPTGLKSHSVHVYAIIVLDILRVVVDYSFLCNGNTLPKLACGVPMDTSSLAGRSAFIFLRAKLWTS